MKHYKQGYYSLRTQQNGFYILRRKKNYWYYFKSAFSSDEGTRAQAPMKTEIITYLGYGKAKAEHIWFFHCRELK